MRRISSTLLAGARAVMTPKHCVRRRSVSFLTILALALAVQLHAVQPAHAAVNCSSPDGYANCVFPSRRAFYRQTGDYAFLWVRPDGSVTSSTILTALDIALANWNSSGAYLHLTRTTRADAATDRLITVTMTTDAQDHTWDNEPDNCNSAWAISDSYYHWVKLRADVLTYTNPSCNTATWQKIIAHELGHALGLAHNNALEGGSHVLMYGFPPVNGPRATDRDIFNSIYPYAAASCSSVPSNANCNNLDYQQQGCSNSTVSQNLSNPYMYVFLHWSGNCLTNWAGASMRGTGTGYVIKQLTIERQESGGWPYWNVTEYPYWGGGWYGNMIWAPANPARACAWYGPPDLQQTYGPVCTSWV